jgi:hypothetical protein
MAREQGVAKQTHQKHAHSWNIWMEFLHRIDYAFDSYLEDLTPSERLRFCGAFMHAVRRGDFGKKGVMGGTARSAVDNVAAHFVESGRISPIINSKGKVHVHIDRQTKGYKKEDPATKHQKALPPVVFNEILDAAFLPRELARAWLVCVALFFAMRSCEYSFVGTEERKTRAARACDVTFRNGARVVPHDSPFLHLSQSVSVDFGLQKSNIRDETVSQDNNDKLKLNPVILMARTIQRLRSYPGYSDKWELYTFYDGKAFSRIASAEILTTLKVAVDAVGVDVLGFTSDEIGTHSVRSSLAMMMYLAKEQIYTIMLVGRWSSDAFLAYIEKQVKEFTKGVSSRMLLNNTFYNTPLAITQSSTHEQNNNKSFQRANSNIFGGRQAGSLRHQLRERN